LKNENGSAVSRIHSKIGSLFAGEGNNLDVIYVRNAGTSKIKKYYQVQLSLTIFQNLKKLAAMIFTSLILP
jgi:hypothetical protein